MSTTAIPSGIQPVERKAQAIGVLPTLIDLTLIAVAGVLLNFFPERVGYWVSAVAPDSFVPILSPDFGGARLALLNLWWSLAFSLGVVNLARRRWVPATRWADLGVTVLAAVALGALAVGGPIGNTAWADGLIKVLLNLACFGAAFLAVRKFVRLFRA